MPRFADIVVDQTGQLNTLGPSGLDLQDVSAAGGQLRFFNGNIVSTRLNSSSPANWGWRVTLGQHGESLMNLPDGYIQTDGLSCPVDPETFVDVIVRTTDGLGHSGIMRAKYQDWVAANHPDGIGAVVGYILGDPSMQIDTVSRWAEEMIAERPPLPFVHGAA